MTDPWPLTPQEQCDLEELRAYDPQGQPWTFQKLWHATVWCAVRESQYTNREYLSRPATQWLFSGSDDFKWVCHFAGLDPEEVVVSLKNKLNPGLDGGHDTKD